MIMYVVSVSTTRRRAAVPGNRYSNHYDSLSPEISDFRDEERRLREPSFEP